MVVRKFIISVLAGVLLVGCQSNTSNKQHADRNEFYQDVNSANVIVQESYGMHKGIALPFKSTAEAWLRIAGVTVVDDAAGADCVIRIVAEGEPLKATYGVSRELFTGARLTGTIQIERPAMHKDEVRFSGVMDKTAFDGFKFRLATLMGRYFGRSVLLIALDDYNSKGVLRDSAIEALAALGKPSVPYLIDAFRFCSPEAEKGVGEALEKITGEKFGSDVKRWNEWFSRQGQKR